MEVTLGGERLGSGKKDKIWLREYERSTHNVSSDFISTMASGVLVPFMTKVALPGSVHEIDLSADVLTHPTVGPLFGSYKVQYDVFQIPIRLYQGKLHMNMINIGRDMSKVILPQVKIKGENPPVNADDYGYRDYDNWQINPSSIFKYLGISGLGIK